MEKVSTGGNDKPRLPVAIDDCGQVSAGVLPSGRVYRRVRQPSVMAMCPISRRRDSRETLWYL